VALGQATDAVQKAMNDLGAPPTLNSSFQGTAQAFQQSLGTVPLLILAALVAIYIVLGVLYELHPSDHHPVDAAVGRRRRARDPDGVRI